MLYQLPAARRQHCFQPAALLAALTPQSSSASRPHCNSRLHPAALCVPAAATDPHGGYRRDRGRGAFKRRKRRVRRTLAHRLWAKRAFRRAINQADGSLRRAGGSGNAG